MKFIKDNITGWKVFERRSLLEEKITRHCAKEGFVANSFHDFVAKTNKLRIGII